MNLWRSVCEKSVREEGNERRKIRKKEDKSGEDGS
jgi:hypothetical protein